MADKRAEIMQSAIHFFSEKGYFSTSVQEIANDCRISKGSLYNLFDSKEDLLIQVIEHNHRKMLQRAMNVNLDSSLSVKERFIKKIVVQMQGFRENKDFIVMLLRALPPHDNPRIPLLMKRIRVTMANWYKDCLIEAFGDKIEPCIWDFVLMFQGTLKEYLSLAVHENKDIDFQKAARFIVEQFDIMICHTEEKPEPVLTSHGMKEYENFDMDLQPQSKKEQLDHLMEHINQEISNSSWPGEERKEMLAAVQSLQNEIHQSEPRRFLIKGLLLYLTEKEELEVLVHRVEKVLGD